MPLTRRITATLILLSFLAAPSLADIAVPGYKQFHIEARLDFGDLKDRCYSLIEVKEGDTLSAIAKKHLGDASRYPEIERLNPELDPDGIRPGDEILLPPRKADGSGRRYFIYYRSGPGASSRPTLLGQDRQIRGPYMARVYAVPETAREEFEALFADRKKSPRADDIDPELGVAISASIDLRMSLPNANATERVDGHVRLLSVKDKVLSIEYTRQHFDRKGREIDSNQQSASALPLLGVGLLGLMVIGFIGWKRRRELSVA